MSRYSMLIAALMLAVWCIPCEAPAQTGGWTHIDRVWGFIYRGVACADSMHCAVIGDSAALISRLRRTTDGGRTWKNILDDPVIFPTKPTKLFFRTVAHPSPGTFFVVCDSGVVFRTRNDGTTWDTTRLPVDGSRLFGLSMRGDLGYLSAGPRYLFKTEDCGTNWRPIDIRLPDSLRHLVISPVHIVDSEAVVVRLVSGDDKGLGWSMDGGATWKFIETSQLRNCSAISFTDRLHGWAVGGESIGIGDLEKDIIAATTDGGYTWEYQVYDLIPAAFGLRAVAFVDSSNGIAVGEIGKILRTTDGGQHWIKQESGLDTNDISNMLYLAYPSINHAYTVSTNFYILAYRNVPSTVPRPAPEPSPLVAPNPVRHATVKISIPDASDADRVEIVDLLGSVVVSLNQSTIDANGRRTFLWDTGASPSGLYFARWMGDAESRCAPIYVK